MADQLFLSYRLRGYTESNMLRHYERLLRLFPFSRLSTGASVLRIAAVSMNEPPLFERSMQDPVDVDLLLASAREFTTSDCAVQVDSWWDLWQYDQDWKLTPTRVTLLSFGPTFEHDSNDQLRIEFGIDTHFLPQPELPNHLFMARSNIRSLLHLVAELDRALSPEQRRLWTESGENFADRLQHALVDEGLV
jgi:hypothetical protein